jgi:hypothetical protein
LKLALSCGPSARGIFWPDWPERRFPRWRGLVLVGLLCVGRLGAITLEELSRDAQLTPKRFAGYFSDFKYAFHEQVQAPAAFLASQTGDCDDYAVLADLVFKPKGYGTHLVMVRMPGLTAHVVCYVAEAKGYLDYNNRTFFFKVQRCAPSIRGIAGKVAKSFDANWTSASEFRFKNGVKYALSTIAKTDPPDRDPALGQAGPSWKVDF